MKIRLTFLGTSGAVGIPVIGCKCSVCLSQDPYNRRTRPGALLQINEKKILIDVGPDFYHQAHRHQIFDLDGAILTHAHFDHVAGLDDLRVFSFLTKKPLPLLASESTAKDLMRSFGYLFDKEHKPKFSLQVLDNKKHKSSFLDIDLNYFFYSQSGMQVTGYRFGSLAYVTDIKEYDASLYKQLEGVKTLVMSTLEWNPTRAHLGIHEVVEIASQLQVEKLYMTHIGHELEHYITQKKLPSFAFLAYDGLSIDCHR